MCCLKGAWLLVAIEHELAPLLSAMPEMITDNVEDDGGGEVVMPPSVIFSLVNTGNR